MRRRLSVSWPRVAIAALALGWLALSGARAGAQGPEKEGVKKNEITVGVSVKNDVSLPLRDIPVAPVVLQPQHVMREPLGYPRVFSSAPDPVVQGSLPPAAMPSPILSFTGIPFPGVGCNCAPPDTNGEVGATQYVQIVNEGIQVFDKTTGASVLGPINIATLWSGFGGVCQTNGGGDPVALYDQLADRWIVSQFAGTAVPTDECVAVSQTSDATGAWFRYDFHLGRDFFDYPKLSVWPDAYYMSMNVFNSAATAFLGPQPFALDRAAMLTGAPATIITPGLQSTALGTLLPGDLDGSNPPPAGAPNPWLSTQLPTWRLFRFHVDFALPANSNWTLGGSLVPAAYSTAGAGVPQLGTPDLLDNLADRPMFRLAYRRFADSHEALVGNLTVSSGGVTGIRWWEIDNATGGAPAFAQQGTYQPDATWRWMGSTATDASGDLSIGFSASSASIFPQVRYAGRLATDPPGTLGQGEATLHAGTGSQTDTSNRWGDYSGLTVDPVDDCTFWYTTEYYDTTSSFNWRTRIGNFRFPNCSIAPIFTLTVTPASLDVCSPADGAYTVNIGSVQGFTNPVTLSATGNPVGTTVGFSTNPVTPPGSSSMTIGNTGAAAFGPYTITVRGQSPDPITQSQNVTLKVFTGAPSAPTLTAPLDGTIDQPLSPTFTWSAATQASSYTLEIATDAAFSNIVHTAAGLTTTTYNGAATLNSNTLYFWRVRGLNACGTGSHSSAFSFTTLALPGDCPAGTVASILYSQDFEAGPAGWTHTGTGDTWTLSGARPHSGVSSFFASEPITVSDQQLVSPAIVIPPGNLPVVLKFWNYQDLQPRTGGCYDGVILEISTTGPGGPWTQAPGASLLTDPYDGLVSTNFGNPLGGRDAWCGAPQPYLFSVVSLDAYAGQTVNFRFREGTDTSFTREGWYIDDVLVQDCPAVPVELQSLSLK